MTKKKTKTSTPKSAAAAYGIEHKPDCASGERAEVRGKCDCGAVDDRPWRLRAIPATHPERPGVEVVVDRVLSMREAVDLAMTIQELTRVEAEHWGRKECSRLEREIGEKGELARARTAFRAPSGEALDGPEYDFARREGLLDEPATVVRRAFAKASGLGASVVTHDDLPIATPKPKREYEDDRSDPLAQMIDTGRAILDRMDEQDEEKPPWEQ